MNGSMLDAMTSDLYEMLKSKGLGRVNPIFEDKPTTELRGSKDFAISFKRDLYLRPSKIGSGKDLENWVPTIMWWIVGGLIFRQESRPFKKITDHGTKHSAYGLGVNRQKLQLILSKDMPVYIDCVIRVIRKHSPKSMIFIFDGLPGELRINGFHYKLEDDRKIILRMIVTDFGGGGETLKFKNALNIIISNKGLSFKEAVHKVLKLQGLVVQVDFSYCLTCGEAIEKVNARSEPNLFCKNPKYSNPNECRNIFRYWQKARLGLKSVAERKEHSSLIYRKLQELLQASPLTAFEDLKKNHRELYIDRRK